MDDIDNRFKPGKSGNPSGRPKRSKSFREDLDHLVQQKIRIAGTGQEIPAIEAMLIGFVNRAMEGDLKAFDFINSFKPEWEPDRVEYVYWIGPPVTEETILAHYMDKPQEVIDYLYNQIEKETGDEC